MGAQAEQGTCHVHCGDCPVEWRPLTLTYLQRGPKRCHRRPKFPDLAFRLFAGQGSLQQGRGQVVLVRPPEKRGLVPGQQWHAIAPARPAVAPTFDMHRPEVAE